MESVQKKERSYVGGKGQSDTLKWAKRARQGGRKGENQIDVTHAKKSGSARAKKKVGGSLMFHGIQQGKRVLE